MQQNYNDENERLRDKVFLIKKTVTIAKKYKILSFDPLTLYLSTILDIVQSNCFFVLSNSENKRDIQKAYNKLIKYRGNSTEPIDAACAYPSLDLIRFLVERVKININAVNRKGLTPLMMACRANAMHIVTYLLSCPYIDPNVTTIWGVTALHMACCQGNQELVKLLLSHPKTDINTCVKRSRWLIPYKFLGSPFIIAILNRNFEIVELILQDHRFQVLDSSELVVASATVYPNKKTQLKHVKMLLKHGADVKLDLDVGQIHLNIHEVNFVARLKLKLLEKYFIHLYFPKNRLKLKSGDIGLIASCILESSLHNSTKFKNRFKIDLAPEDIFDLFKNKNGYFQDYLENIATDYVNVSTKNIIEKLHKNLN